MQFLTTRHHVYWMYVLYCIKWLVHSKISITKKWFAKWQRKRFQRFFKLSQVAQFNFVFETLNKKWLLLISLHTYTSLSSRFNWIHLRKKRFIIAKFYYVWDVGGTTLNASNFSLLMPIFWQMAAKQQKVKNLLQQYKPVFPNALDSK